MIKLTYPFRGQYIEINDTTFRRIWSEYDDVVLWDKYNQLDNEWKSVKNEHHKKLELIYNKTVENNLEQQIQNTMEFLKS